jgi:hypothetical protein
MNRYNQFIIHGLRMGQVMMCNGLKQPKVV